MGEGSPLLDGCLSNKHSNSNVTDNNDPTQASAIRTLAIISIKQQPQQNASLCLINFNSINGTIPTQTNLEALVDIQVLNTLN